VSIEVPYEISAGVPDTFRVCVDGCEDNEQVLDVHILRRDPPRLLEPGVVRGEPDRESEEVTFLYRTKERR